MLNGLFLKEVREALATDGLLHFTFCNIGWELFGKESFRLDGMNIQMDKVPEPTTLLLRAFGLGGACMRRKNS